LLWDMTIGVKLPKQSDVFSDCQTQSHTPEVL